MIDEYLTESSDMIYNGYNQKSDEVHSGHAKENPGVAAPGFFIWANCRAYDDLTTCTRSDQLPVPRPPTKE